MKKQTLYTIGYTGRSIDELAAIAGARDAGIVDIRFNAWSREPKWRGPDLRKSMEHRSIAYDHIRELGNVNYSNNLPIDIAKPEEGLAALWELVQNGPQILLCACPDVETCHRKVVAEMLQEQTGIEAEHVGEAQAVPESTEQQTELF